LGLKRRLGMKIQFIFAHAVDASFRSRTEHVAALEDKMKTQFFLSAVSAMNRCIQSMPARPLFWLTTFFMLGISAYRLFGASLPAQTYYLAFAALVLISVMVVTLWFRVRTAQFAVPALLFVVFGVWATFSDHTESIQHT